MEEKTDTAAFRVLRLHHGDSDVGTHVVGRHQGPFPQLARRVSEGHAQPDRRPHRAPLAGRAQGHARHRRISGKARYPPIARRFGAAPGACAALGRNARHRIRRIQSRRGRARTSAPPRSSPPSPYDSPPACRSRPTESPKWRRPPGLRGGPRSKRQPTITGRSDGANRPPMPGRGSNRLRRLDHPPARRRGPVTPAPARRRHTARAAAHPTARRDSTLRRAIERRSRKPASEYVGVIPPKLKHSRAGAAGSRRKSGRLAFRIAARFTRSASRGCGGACRGSRGSLRKAGSANPHSPPRQRAMTHLYTAGLVRTTGLRPVDPGQPNTLHHGDVR